MFKHIVLGAIVLVLSAIGSYGQDQIPQKESPPPAQKPAEARTSVSGEVAVSSMYHGFDVGGRFYRAQTYKGWITVEHRFSDRITGSFTFWGQFSGHERHPNGAEEVDTVGDLGIRMTKTSALTVEMANYKVNRLSVHKVGVVLAKQFRIGKQPVTLSDELTRFTTSRPDLLPGGVLNKTHLTASHALPGQFTFTGRVSLGFDNGPFRLGGPAAMFFLQGRLERPITKHWSVFIVARHSRPIAGTNIRHPLTSGEGGFAFKY